MNHSNGNGQDGLFTTETAGLPEVTRPGVTRLHDGGRLELRIAPVVKHLDGAEVRMLAYNGSIPGPTLRVRQGSEIIVHVRNDADTEATVHWHGLRLDNAYDGVPYETQAPIAIGGDFTYQRALPRRRPLLVPPAHPRGLRPRHGPLRQPRRRPRRRGLLAAASTASSSSRSTTSSSRTARSPRSTLDGPNFVAMGRFGNVMLTGGETNLALDAARRRGRALLLHEHRQHPAVQRRHPGARMKLVGGDSGRYEHETFVDEVLLAPSERAIVDVLFDDAGFVPTRAPTPRRTYVLGTVTVDRRAGRASR